MRRRREGSKRMKWKEEEEEVNEFKREGSQGSKLENEWNTSFKYEWDGEWISQLWNT